VSPNRIGTLLWRRRSLHAHAVEGVVANVRSEAVVELGVIRTGTDAGGSITTATTITGRVVYGSCAGTATA
jgi:hypothetical protein